MESPTPLCLFTGRVEARDGEYVFEVPEREVDLDTLQPGETYRVGVYPDVSTSSTTDDPGQATTESNATNTRTNGRGGNEEASTSAPESSRPPVSDPADSPTVNDASPHRPPVTEGETIELQIEDVGDQGDGLARVGPGYVVFVPDTEVGQQPLVRVTTVRENFAFAEVVEQ